MPTKFPQRSARNSGFTAAGAPFPQTRSTRHRVAGLHDVVHWVFTRSLESGLAQAPPPPLRCNLGVYPLAKRTGTQTHRSLFFLQAHSCSQYSARTLSNRHRYMQVIRETVNAPGCVTSVFQPGTNLKTRKLHCRGVGSLYSLLSPKRIKSGVIELQCDLRELYFSKPGGSCYETDKRKRKRIFVQNSVLKDAHMVSYLSRRKAYCTRYVKYNST